MNQSTLDQQFQHVEFYSTTDPRYTTWLCGKDNTENEKYHEMLFFNPSSDEIKDKELLFKQYTNRPTRDCTYKYQ